MVVEPAVDLSSGEGTLGAPVAGEADSLGEYRVTNLNDPVAERGCLLDIFLQTRKPGYLEFRRR